MEEQINHISINLPQERFCQEYIKDLNGAQAAIRAGYSAKSAKETASRMLSYPAVREEAYRRIFPALSAAANSASVELRILSTVQVWESLPEFVCLAKAPPWPCVLIEFLPG